MILYRNAYEKPLETGMYMPDRIGREKTSFLGLSFAATPVC